MRFTIIQLLIAGIALGAPLDKTVRQCTAEGCSAVNANEGPDLPSTEIPLNSTNPIQFPRYDPKFAGIQGRDVDATAAETEEEAGDNKIAARDDDDEANDDDDDKTIEARSAAKGKGKSGKDKSGKDKNKDDGKDGKEDKKDDKNPKTTAQPPPTQAPKTTQPPKTTPTTQPSATPSGKVCKNKNNKRVATSEPAEPEPTGDEEDGLEWMD